MFCGFEAGVLAVVSLQIRQWAIVPWVWYAIGARNMDRLCEFRASGRQVGSPVQPSCLTMSNLAYSQDILDPEFLH